MPARSMYKESARRWVPLQNGQSRDEPRRLKVKMMDFDHFKVMKAKKMRNRRIKNKVKNFKEQLF